MTIKQSLVSGRGETFTLNLVFKDTTGNPVNLTGHTVDLNVSKAGIGTPVGTYSATVDDSGNITIKVADEVTATWPVGKLAYKVIHTSPDGDEKWLLFGPLTIVTGADV